MTKLEYLTNKLDEIFEQGQDTYFLAMDGQILTLAIHGSIDADVMTEDGEILMTYNPQFKWFATTLENLKILNKNIKRKNKNAKEFKPTFTLRSKQHVK